MLEKEALVLLVNLSRLMVAKIEESISHVQGCVNGSIEIVFAILYFRMILRARLPIPLQDRDPDWELGSGLVLAQ